MAENERMSTATAGSGACVAENGKINTVVTEKEGVFTATAESGACVAENDEINTVTEKEEMSTAIAESGECVAENDKINAVAEKEGMSTATAESGERVAEYDKTNTVTEKEGMNTDTERERMRRVTAASCCACMAKTERGNAVTAAPGPPGTSDVVVQEQGIKDRPSPQGGGVYSPLGWPSSGLSTGRARMPALPPGTGLTLAALAPVPQGRPVPILQPPHVFQIPRKRINSPADIERFQQSDAGKTFIGFVVELGDSVKGMKLSDYCRESPITLSLVGILSRMMEWVDELPPRQQPSRYGNLAFRDWQARLEQEGPDLVRQILPEHLQEAVVELFPYFADSFGNATRIDYGTGHEVNFAAFLLCLARLGILKQEDYQAIVLRVFVRYLDLLRKLQTTYWLEPAGSHGVWGLDDYHFLPFIFGAAQLVDHKYMKPKSIHNQDILDNFSKEYFYLGCIDFVKKVKKGPLAEHSPMIDDISGVATWSKVYGGMLKMYKAEVLEKVPIMQHFLFGSFIPWQ